MSTRLLSLFLILSPVRMKAEDDRQNTLASAPEAFLEDEGSDYWNGDEDWAERMEVEMTEIMTSYLGEFYGGYQTYPLHFTLDREELERGVRQIPECENMTLVRMRNCKHQHQLLEQLTWPNLTSNRQKRDSEDPYNHDNLLRYFPFFGNYFLAQDTERSFKIMRGFQSALEETDLALNKTIDWVQSSMANLSEILTETEHAHAMETLHIQTDNFVFSHARRLVSGFIEARRGFLSPYLVNTKAGSVAMREVEARLPTHHVLASDSPYDLYSLPCELNWDGQVFYFTVYVPFVFNETLRGYTLEAPYQVQHGKLAKLDLPYLGLFGRKNNFSMSHEEFEKCQHLAGNRFGCPLEFNHARIDPCVSALHGGKAIATTCEYEFANLVTGMRVSPHRVWVMHANKQLCRKQCAGRATENLHFQGLRLFDRETTCRYKGPNYQFTAVAVDSREQRLTFRVHLPREDDNEQPYIDAITRHKIKITMEKLHFLRQQNFSKESIERIHAGEVLDFMGDLADEATSDISSLASAVSKFKWLLVDALVICCVAGLAYLIFRWRRGQEKQEKEKSAVSEEALIEALTKVYQAEKAKSQKCSENQS